MPCPFTFFTSNLSFPAIFALYAPYIYEYLSLHSMPFNLILTSPAALALLLTPYIELSVVSLISTVTFPKALAPLVTAYTYPSLAFFAVRTTLPFTA